MLSGKQQIQRTVWAEFKSGFEVEISYLPRAKLADIATRAQVQRWDHNSNQAVASVDNKKYRDAIAKEVVKGWRGLTLNVLKQIVLLDEYPDAEVPYTFDDCVWLLEQSAEFENWVGTVATHAALYHAERRAEETKNS